MAVLQYALALVPDRLLSNGNGRDSDRVFTVAPGKHLAFSSESDCDSESDWTLRVFMETAYERHPNITVVLIDADPNSRR